MGASKKIIITESTGGGASQKVAVDNALLVGGTPTTGATPKYTAEGTVEWGVGAGDGDMTAAMYDPGDVQDDAFSMDNMVETATKKVFTSAERTKLTGIEAGAKAGDMVAANNLSDVVSASVARSNLGLGTMATQAANTVAITGGSITGMSTPTATADVATKGYVDEMGAGRTWAAPVEAILDFTSAEPTGQSAGERWINTGTGDSSETSTSVVANNIYQWDGSAWTEIVPDEAVTVVNKDDNGLWTFNGTAWVSTGSEFAHNSATGLQGGQANQYYHLTTAQHTSLTGLAGLSFAHGDVLYRDAAGFQRLAAGTSGQFLETQGAGAAPRWGAPTGAGDMLAATYDPNAISGDAFDMDNMVESATKKILTDTERTALAAKAIAPATNTANNVPQWDGADSKTLKNGLAVGNSNTNLVQRPADNAVGADTISEVTAAAGVTVDGTRIKDGAINIIEPSADHTATGLTDSGTVGESVVFGDLLYMKSDGKWWKSDADAAATMPGMRLALETAAADASCSMLAFGRARDDTWDWTVGGLVFASTDAGALTQTRPTGSGDQIQVVGLAYHADYILFQPGPILGEIA